MRKYSKICSLVLVIVMMMSVLSGCGKTTYEAASGFFYSSDKGHSYGDGTKEYAVGETVYMKVMFKVTSDSKKTIMLMHLMIFRAPWNLLSPKKLMRRDNL